MIRRSSVRRGAGAAAAFALAATVVAGAVVAQPEGAQAAAPLTIAADNSKGPLPGPSGKPFFFPETNITSLGAKDGVVSLTMTSELYTSQQRIVLWANDKYVGETYGGSAYYLSVSTGPNGTVTLSARVPANAIVRVGSHAGYPGAALSFKTMTMVRTALEGDLQVEQLSDGRLHLHVPVATLNSTRRLMLFVNGTYVGETFNGDGYYIGHSSPGAPDFYSDQAFKKGDRVEVRLAPNSPGMSADGSEVLLSQTL